MDGENFRFVCFLESMVFQVLNLEDTFSQIWSYTYNYARVIEASPAVVQLGKYSVTFIYMQLVH